MYINNDKFVQAILLDIHPLKKENFKLKFKYYVSLEFILKSEVLGCEYIQARLLRYKQFLLSDFSQPKMTDSECLKYFRSLIGIRNLFKRNQYLYLLFCDVALILQDEYKLMKVRSCLKRYLGSKQNKNIDLMFKTIFSDQEVQKKLNIAKDLIDQIRDNKKFMEKREKRFLITANVSAGKSTLINAITGEKLARTSQETCTGNLSYLYNKPFEDNVIHLSASPLNFHASYDDLANIESTVVSSIAAHFKTTLSHERVCIIDTPGVNSTLFKDHRKITTKAIQEENYDKLVYVLNANKLGTDEELSYIKWISKNVPHNKVIFVINKLDDFKISEDSISESINNVRNDILSCGVKNPIICPISAYYSYLLRKKQYDKHLSEDEIDEYALYTKKFRRKEYDLSHYYNMKNSTYNDSVYLEMSRKCGIYGLEKILLEGEDL